MNSTTFEPDWVSPPGDTIAMLLEQRRVSQDTFAASLRMTTNEIESLLAGKTIVDERLATLLAQSLGSTREFWLRRQAVYEEQTTHFASRAQPDHHLGWLREVPCNYLATNGWLDGKTTKTEQVTNLLHFFAVPTVDAWRTEYQDAFGAIAYRTSKTFESEQGALATWLRCCELQAEKLDCDPWNPDGFRESLEGIKALTRIDDPGDFVPQVQKLCAANGVAVVIVKAPSGCRASGATRFVTDNRAILMLSFRHLSDDHLWFSFFHEAGHLLLHKHRLFIEFERSGQLTSAEEMEANEFAEKTLIPSREDLLKLPLDVRPIMRFAKDTGISPGIVVGQLQHLGRIKRNHFNKMKCYYKWRDED